MLGLPCLYAQLFLQRHLGYLEAVLDWAVFYKRAFKSNGGISYALLWKMGKALAAWILLT